MDELKRFEADLNNSEELRKKLDETARRIAEEGQAQSDGEIMVKAAKELGYEITIAALEQAKASDEVLDVEELTNVAGGRDSYKLCWQEYECIYAWHDSNMDEEGHNGSCITAWHCFAATLHTDTDSKKVACWSNYKCLLSEHSF